MRKPSSGDFIIEKKRHGDQLTPVEPLDDESFTPQLVHQRGTSWVVTKPLEISQPTDDILRLKKLWTATKIKWLDQSLLLNNSSTKKITFSVDGSFCPERSHLR